MRALFSVLRTAGAHRGLLPAALLALAADLAGVTLLTLAAWLIARAAEQPRWACCPWPSSRCGRWP